MSFPKLYIVLAMDLSIVIGLNSKDVQQKTEAVYNTLVIKHVFKLIIIMKC